MSYYFVPENSKKHTVVLSFGRMNPPTIGHQRLMKKIVEVSKNEGGVPMLFLSHSQDRKNPLSYQEKLRYVRSNAPLGLIVVDSPMRTIYEIIDALVSQGFIHIVVICGSDRVDTFSRIENYKELMGFSSFKVISSGMRDEDSDDIENNISASKMREYAKNEDFENFMIGAGCSKSLIKDMYDATRRGLCI